MPSREDSNVVYLVDCNLGTCTCQQGVNGNACSHQAAVALKFGINNANFIPQTAHERFNLGTLAVGRNNNFRVTKFVSLHQNEIENNPDCSGDCEIEEEMLPSLIDSVNGKQTENNESSSTYPSDEIDIPDDISLNEILKLHHEVSEDIEYRLCTSDNNFRKCYFNYIPW